MRSGSLTRQLTTLRAWLTQYWFGLANSLFWLVVALETWATATVMGSRSHQMTWFILTWALPGWLFCSWLHRSIQRRPGWRALQGLKRAALVISLLTGFTICLSLLLHGIHVSNGDTNPAMTTIKLWIYMLELELHLMVWVGFYLLIAESRDLLKLQRRNAAMELAVSRAQLSLLSAAFQPHFLMNAMNALIACRHDPNAVESAGEGLAGYLRYALDRSDNEWEMLTTQIEALNNYLSVEELRFGERLDAKMHIDPQLLQEVVPRFLLQPLVENAVKHGTMNRAGRLLLRIKLERSSKQLQLMVSNTGELSSTSDSKLGVGYGLEGLRQRLQLHYGSSASLNLEQTDGWVTAAVLLPLR